MGEGAKRWGEQWKKYLGLALSAFYLVGSLPRQGLPLLSPLADQMKGEKSYNPPDCGPLPSRKRRGEKSKWPCHDNSSHPSWMRNIMKSQVLSIHGGPTRCSPNQQREVQRDPDVVGGWTVSPWSGQRCSMALNQGGRSPVVLASIFHKVPAMPVPPSCPTFQSQLQANSLIKRLYSKDSLCVFVYLWISS